MTQHRPLRADAIRNRVKILDTAREQISTHGVEVGMDEIAAAAGVAVGTLYRHFPNKTELVAAVIADFSTQLTEDAEAASSRVSQGARALDELTDFIRRVVEAAAVNHAAKAAARAAGTSTVEAAAEARAAAAVNHLLEVGREAGDISPDITTDDIYLLVHTAPTDQPAQVRGRWLTLMLRSLVPRE